MSILLLLGTWLEKGRKRRAGVYHPALPISWVERRPTLLIPVQLAPYGTIGVRVVVDVDIVVSGMLL